MFPISRYFQFPNPARWEAAASATELANRDGTGGRPQDTQEAAGLHVDDGITREPRDPRRTGGSPDNNMRRLFNESIPWMAFEPQPSGLRKPYEP